MGILEWTAAIAVGSWVVAVYFESPLALQAAVSMTLILLMVALASE